MGRNDFAILDKDDHASIVDGCFMARGMNQAEMRRFSHNDPDSLSTRAKLPEDAGKLVIVDGVYSMVATSPRCRSWSRFASGTARGSWWTTRTASACWATVTARPRHFGLTDEVDLIMGTFSKSLRPLAASSPETSRRSTTSSTLHGPSLSAPACPLPTRRRCWRRWTSSRTSRSTCSGWDNADYMRAGLKRPGPRHRHEQHAGHPDLRPR